MTRMEFPSFLKIAGQFIIDLIIQITLELKIYYLRKLVVSDHLLY
jgi:hypothetical protein